MAYVSAACTYKFTSADSAFGEYALLSLLSGNYNSGLGYNSGVNVTGGSNNTFLGAASGATAGSTTGNYRTAIGAGSMCETDNTVTIGRTSDNVVLPGIQAYANNAAALGAGLVAGMLYRIGDELAIVH